MEGPAIPPDSGASSSVSAQLATGRVRPGTTATKRRVQSAVRRGADHLRAQQSADGRFECLIEVGPVAIASQLILEHFAGVSRDPATAVTALRMVQRDDGSFPAWVHATTGSVPTTALVAAALRCAGVADDDPAQDRARRWVREHGGDEAIAAAFSQTGEVSAVFLVAAGELSPDVLPPLPLSVAIAPLLERIVDGRIHAGNLLAMFSILAVAEHRRAQQAPRPRGWLRSALGGAVRELQRTRAIDYLATWQNPDGSFNQALFSTQLMALGYAALGMGAEEPPLRDALAWLDARKVDGEHLRMQAIPNDVWSTAMVGLALDATGRGVDRTAAERAVEHLHREQLREPQPRANQRRRGAQRTGGWAFQSGNPTMPDCDDTGLVLAFLGEVTPQHASRDAFAAIDRGLSWLSDMQNPDGGWPAYVWNLPSKKPGPMFDGEQIMPDLRDPKSALAVFVDPPPELGDPATEGVTARVLWGLGACGVGRDDARVCRALEFLRAQQCESGAFWDRWMTCYLPGTATVVLGLHAVGEDMEAPYVQRAVDWMMSCQNEDGGFGELPEAFSDPEVAGRGPSMPGVTGFVLLAALRAGTVGTPAMERAAQYLLGSQGRDGSWDNAGWVNPYVPPDTFYEYPFASTCMPVMALAEFAALAR